MIDPHFLIEEGLRLENLLSLAAIVVAADVIFPKEASMKPSIPRNKAEAMAQLKALGDELDGVPDSDFDPKAFGKRVTGAFADDWKENVIVAVAAVAAWEILQALWRLA